MYVSRVLGERERKNDKRKKNEESMKKIKKNDELKEKNKKCQTERQESVIKME